MDTIIEVDNLLGTKAETTIRVFERGDFYSCVGDDAEIVADKVLKSRSAIKTASWKSVNSVYLNLNSNQYRHMLYVLLIKHQYRVELYSAKEKPPRLLAKGTPGNIEDFHDELYDKLDERDTGSGILALKFIKDPTTRLPVIAMALVLLDRMEILVAEIPMGPNLSTFKALLAHTNPRELIIPSDTGLYAGIVQYAQSIQIFVTVKKGSEFNSDQLVENLNKLLKFRKGQVANSLQISAVKEMEKGAMECVNAVIDYCSLLQSQTYFSSFRLTSYSMDNHMRLDPSSLHALELFSSSSTGCEQGTLYHLLNQCCCGSGERLLDQWVRQPSTDIKIINERLDAVEAFISEPARRETIRSQFLKHIPDLSAILKKLLRKKARLQDCYRLYLVVQSLPNLIRRLEGISSSLAPTLVDSFNEVIVQPLQKCFVGIKTFLGLIETTVDVERVENNREFRIRPDFDESLFEVTEQLKAIRKKMETELVAVSRKIGLEPQKSVKLETADTANMSGCFFRVTRKDDHNLRGVSGVRIIDTQKAGVRFRTDGLDKLNHSFLEYNEDLKSREDIIIQQVVKTAATYESVLKTLSEQIGVIDVICALAHVASSASPQYVRPRMLPKGKGVIKFDGLRHATLESNRNVSFVPNDLCLDGDSRRMVLVTGPNMGGKSTYLRSCGVAVIMAHIGSFVPATSAQISIVDGVFTRVGASDDQSRGVSTFMAEMIETNLILEGATEDSLVIVDELGRGTSTYDGFGLAWAIAEQLVVENKCLCLFATHFHEMAELEKRHSCVSNVHVSVMVEDGHITLLYNVRPGPSSQSFGINVAEILHFPPAIIQDAKEKLDELQRNTSVVTELAGLLEKKDAAGIRKVLSNLQKEKLSASLWSH